MKWLKVAVSLSLAATAFVALDTRIGLLPPLGKFLNPFAGFWLNDTSTDAIPANTTVPGLRDDVEVVWDDRRVPHIFAKNTHDLYLAQGFITARDRLWQIDFQTRAAAGRLSEVIGPRTIDYDRFQRRIGMVYGAEKTRESIGNEPETAEAIEAYVEGVNAWIARLDTKHRPVEYKMLDYEPERYTALRGSLLLQFFRWDLSFSNNDYAMSRALDALGEEICGKIYPLRPPFLQPVIPIGTPWKFSPLGTKAPATGYLSPSGGGGPLADTEIATGSNNWVVSGGRTASGYPLLCYDPHLALTLPSVWYEIQLAAPDVNVYGFTPPGTPGVVFGFNSHIAWGGTNASSDVTDWYGVRFKDRSLSEYWYDGAWRTAERRTEEIRVRGGPSIIDTTVYTHHGPVVYREGETPFDSSVPPGRAMRWVALEPSNELWAILRMNRAKNYEEFRDAIDRFECPEMNIAYADAHGDIAIWHAGRYPLRWVGQGRTILDGSDPANDWQGWIPKSHLPHVKNPPRGFLSSSNQHPTDETYPYYLGWNYAGADRANRINERLAALKRATPRDMIDLQLDVLDAHARTVLPVLLPLIDRDSLGAEEVTSCDALRSWNYEHQKDSIAARIFAYWWWWFYQETWSDEIRRAGASVEWPSRDVTKWLVLNEPSSPFFDNRESNRVETLADIALTAFRKAHADLTQNFGPIGPRWAVGRSRGTRIEHLGRLPGFGREGLRTGGTTTTVNALSSTHGPTYRLVVSLEPQVKAWGIYPGGQSGNPGSPQYDAFIDAWVEGKMFELIFLDSPHDRHDRIIGRTTLRGAR